MEAAASFLLQCLASGAASQKRLLKYLDVKCKYRLLAKLGCCIYKTSVAFFLGGGGCVYIYLYTYALPPNIYVQMYMHTYIYNPVLKQKLVTLLHDTLNLTTG